MTPSPIPADYTCLVTGDAEMVAHQSVAAAMRDVLLQDASLYAWASRASQSRALHGRAPVYVATLPGGAATLAVRHAWHGGALASLTGDRFRAPTRAPTELRNALLLRERGIGTADVMGYVIYPAGPGLRRVDVATRYIPDSSDLGAAIGDDAAALGAEAALPAVATLLAALARHRVVHADLNVKNILLVRESSHAVGAIVIDVDVVRMEAHRTALSVMDANLARLTRSMRKWRAKHGAVVSDRAIARLEQAARRALTASTAMQPR